MRLLRCQTRVTYHPNIELWIPRASIVSVSPRLAAAFADRFGTALDDGKIFPVIDRMLDLADAREAHRVLKASEHFGKVVLRVP